MKYTKLIMPKTNVDDIYANCVSSFRELSKTPKYRKAKIRENMLDFYDYNCILFGISPIIAILILGLVLYFNSSWADILNSYSTLSAVLIAVLLLSILWGIPYLHYKWLKKAVNKYCESVKEFCSKNYISQYSLFDYTDDELSNVKNAHYDITTIESLIRIVKKVNSWKDLYHILFDAELINNAICINAYINDCKVDQVVINPLIPKETKVLSFFSELTKSLDTLDLSFIDTLIKGCLEEGN